MQTQTIAPHLEALKKALGPKLGTTVDEQDLTEEFQKYLDYGVPADQAVRTILRHHGVQTASAGAPRVATTQERLPLAQVPPASPFVNLKVRIVTINTKSVMARGEAKEIVWGLLGDESGTLPYTSWRPLEGLAKGDVIEIEGAYSKEYNGQSQINFGDRTRIVKLTDADLPRTQVTYRDTPIAEIGESSRGMRVTARVLTVAPREITLKDGTKKTCWAGILADASGKIEFTAWSDLGLKADDAITIEGGYVRIFRGAPQLNFDAEAKVTPATVELPAAEKLQVAPAVPLRIVMEKNGGNDLTVVATLLEVRPGSGLVFRCNQPGCTRVLVAGACRLHNKQEGVPDLRVKAILDDGTGNIGLYLRRDMTEAILGKTLAQCVDEAKAAFRPEVIQDQLKEKLTSRVFRVRGNALSDDYGISLLANSFTPHSEDLVAGAEAVLAKLEAA